MLHAAPERIALGVDLNATHHRGVGSGIVTGVATPVHLGRTSATYDIAVTDEHGNPVCSARLPEPRAAQTDDGGRAHSTRPPSPAPAPAPAPAPSGAYSS